MTDLRQTPEYARYMKQLAWQVVTLRKETLAYQIFIKKIPLLGNVAKLQRPSFVPTAREVDVIAKKHGAAVFYLEPPLNLRFKIDDLGFQHAKSSFLPAKTIQIDLRKTEKQLLAEMKQKTRYNTKIAQKRGVVIEGSQNIESFIKLWHSSAHRRGMLLSQKKEIESLWRSFGPRAHLLLTYDSSLNPRSSYPLAGVLLIRTATTAYYMYAASTRDGNRLFAPTLVAWEAIKLAKKKKCKIFDFEGIYDERYPQTKNWKGFTKFKEGFGGKIITYPGTFVKYYNPLAKLLRL